ncbi:MAG: hypothetical protein AAGE18_11700 [Pseudomonadota bacterium]
MDGQRFTLFAVLQRGRLQYEALLLLASLAETNPSGHFDIVLCEPVPGPLWSFDPRVQDPTFRALLTELGAEIRPFDNQVFGETYPHGNKIEGLRALPPDQPFVFVDTDTVFLAPLDQVPFDFDRPTASLRREDTWPKPDVAGHSREVIWRALYHRFGLDFEASLDPAKDAEDWERYLYFSAGWFFHRDPVRFGGRFLEIAQSIRDAPPPELAGQSLDPWLDQVALPLVIQGLGGGRQTLPPGLLDGRVSCHWRTLPLLYAREGDDVIDLVERIAAPQAIKKHLKAYEPFRKLIYQGKGRRVQRLFTDGPLPRQERLIRKRIREAGLWLR